jgi:hypothetical protein
VKKTTSHGQRACDEASHSERDGESEKVRSMGDELRTRFVWSSKKLPAQSRHKGWSRDAKWVDAGSDEPAGRAERMSRKQLSPGKRRTPSV